MEKTSYSKQGTVCSDALLRIIGEIVKRIPEKFRNAPSSRMEESRLTILDDLVPGRQTVRMETVEASELRLLSNV